MAINQDFPVMNGICPSWADFYCKADPSGMSLITIADIKSINTSSSMEIGEQRGASGGRVIKRTTGSVKYEASMTLYRSGFQNFLEGLKAAAPLRGNQRAMSLVYFGLHMIWTPPGDVRIYEVRIKGCRYTGRALNTAEGSDADTVDVALNPIEIVDMIDGEECGLL